MLKKIMNANIDILKKDINLSLENLRKRRRGNKKKAEYVVVASAVISAVTTISIGLSSLVETWSSIFQGIALILSASLTIIATWDGFYNHKRLWLLQADIVNRLQDIKSDIRHLEANGKPNQQSINDLYSRYKSSFREFNEQWKDLRAEDNSQSNDVSKS